MRVFVLGSTGMLGHAVMRQFPDAIAVTDFDARNPRPLEARSSDFVINCIGAIPQRKPSASDMVKVNAVFPNWLAENTKARIIQIATDCVFSGRHGGYNERSPHNPQDAYGRTKSIGETLASNVMLIRSSIVGYSPRDNASLVGWIRNLEQGARVDGYINHFWNGVTTDAFARVVEGIIRERLFYPGLIHLVPENHMTKNRLVRELAAKLGRRDIEVVPTISPNPINRTLKTLYPEHNEDLFTAAGYYEVPTIKQLIREMQCT